jgi:hypothetical protein
MIDLHSSEPCVDWNCNHAEPTTRIHKLDVLGSVREQERQSITAFKAGRIQSRGKASNLIVKFAKGRLPIADPKRGLIAIILDGSLHGMYVYHLSIALRHEQCRCNAAQAAR